MSGARDALDLLDRGTLAKIAAGFAVAFVLLYLFAVGIGIEEIRAELATADYRWLAAACVSTAVGLVAWAKAWHVVLGVVGYAVPFRKLVVTYYAATFANYVTPLGQAGGEPFIAYVLSRDTEASYEDSLASVVTADLLNLLPFFTFAAVGTAVLVARTSLPTQLEPVAGGLVVFALGVPVLAAVGWQFRFRLGQLAVRLTAPVVRRAPYVSVEGIRTRLRDLNGAFERIAAEPRSLVYALVFSYIGWFFFALPLYLAALTVGSSVPLLLVFFIVPASTLAGLTPSPGGLGGIELALVGMLTVLAGIPSAAAYSIALVYRVACYWFAVAVGGLAALFVVSRS